MAVKEAKQAKPAEGVEANRKRSKRPTLVPRGGEAISEEAEAALEAGKHGEAIRLAQHSLFAQKTSRAYALITRARCAQGDLGNARRRWRRCRARPLLRRARLWQTGRRPEVKAARARQSWMALLLLACAPPPRAPTARSSRGSVFVGGEGVTVAVVPLKPRADKKVLVRVTGSGTVFDDKVILHKLEDGDAGEINYETTYHGRDWVTLSARDGDAYSLAAPGRRDSRDGEVRRARSPRS